MRNWNVEYESKGVLKDVVLSLPMRNWNNFSSTIVFFRLPVLSLPMRNWNAFCDISVRPKSFSFEPTYEELKLIQEHAVILCLQLVLSLPMRNWNISSGICSSICFLVLSLPMRNWNRTIKSRWWPSKICFEPTYEELKLRSNPLICERWPSFEPTYEELKLGWMYCMGCLGCCFEPTYEELKPRQEKDELLALIRFEPTYEELKHHITLIPLHAQVVFWAYLWGIETDPASPPVSTFPCFEPTYEELKLLVVLLCICLITKFWAYLWGIETVYGLGYKGGIPTFWAYLWGIETRKEFDNWYGESDVLSLPMRNWNIVSQSYRDQSKASFEPTYEELKHNSTCLIFAK